jgi:hypothetical protein
MLKTAITAICILLSAFAFYSTASAIQSRQTQSREEATKAIRKTAYEMMKAFLTQDVATFKRHSAKRTLDLIELAYQAARQEPRYQEEFQKAGITNTDQFLSYFMLGMATQYLQGMPLSPEAAATRVANDSAVTFVSDSDARIVLRGTGFARAKLVSRAWKIDLTDWLKEPVLKEVSNPELRAKIKSL